MTIFKSLFFLLFEIVYCFSSDFQTDDWVYRNNLKNRDFDKETPQNFCLERETIAERQGSSEDKNFEKKLTRSKTDPSGCFGINSFVWSIELARETDRGLPSPHSFDMTASENIVFDPIRYRSIAHGELVWVHPKILKCFIADILPGIEHPFFLLISNSDATFPTDFSKEFNIQDLLNNRKILHIFAQNSICKDLLHKVTPIPLGMDFHSLEWRKTQTPAEQEKDLKKILASLQPTGQRIKRAFVDFQHSDTLRFGSHQRYLETGETRHEIFNRLLSTGLIDYSMKKIPRQALWQIKGDYAFSVSPQGNGLDCHRTWEDLVLGCIVIVKTSGLDPLYEGLPVVIVEDWSDITSQNLDKWLEQYSDAFTNPSYRAKLTSKYWKEKMRKTMADILEKEEQ
jgi:hypothetical protein